MAVDTPAKIVVIGAGPIGLETALYARFLGYEVDLLERGRVAESMRGWGHVRLFSPAGMNCSQLGRAALRAQNANHTLPGDDQLLTGRELIESYYLPLSETDLLADGLWTGVEVLAIGREDLLKGDQIGQASRADRPFRLLIRSADDSESLRPADVVIDCSGTYGHPNWLGQGGIPALGELAATGLIDYTLPDLSGEDRQRFSARHTLLVGGGYSAATTAVALAKLAAEAPETHVTWLTRSDRDPPIRRVADDSLPQRDALAGTANRLAAEDASIRH
ncbi:MAG: FAD-dependent oxidoreductase, partial [Pirellulales bacterium]